MQCPVGSENPHLSNGWQKHATSVNDGKGVLPDLQIEFKNSIAN
jgi:hypothetical protein